MTTRYEDEWIRDIEIYRKSVGSYVVVVPVRRDLVEHIINVLYGFDRPDMDALGVEAQ